MVTVQDVQCDNGRYGNEEERKRFKELIRHSNRSRDDRRWVQSENGWPDSSQKDGR
jgi:hypothetical protein